MDHKDVQARYRAGLDITREAGALALEYFKRRATLPIEHKGRQDFVSEADKKTEDLIVARLGAAFPDDSVLGEEGGLRQKGAALWVIDPIDGTANFLRGVPIWGTLIALAVDGVPTVGVVSSPALGKRWWGATGHGAWAQETGHEPRAIRVSRVAELADASLSYNSMQGWDEVGRLDDVVALSRAVWRSRAIGDMWSYMLLAEGALDIVGEFDLKPYDMAALIPIVEEAGGTFTSVTGIPGPWEGNAIATNGLLHDRVLELLAQR